MAAFDIESVIKNGVERALNEPIMNGKSVMQWAEIGMHSQEQWISVKDRLPDDASDILAYYDDGTESRIIPVNYYKGCWYDCVFNRAIDGLETGFIKYWMSLPKAPEVKQNETD